MTKKFLNKQLVFLDFRKNVYTFYDIEVISIGYNDVQVIYSFGKLGNKGKQLMKRFNEEDDKGSSPLKLALKDAYNKIYTKKSEGFVSREKIEKGLMYALKQESLAKDKQSKTGYKVVDKKTKYKCDNCNNAINEKLYEKINKWARGEGNWDFDPTKEYYNKVFCLDCQIEKGIFQKVFKEKE